MMETVENNQPLTTEQRYRLLRYSLAHYMLLQVSTFIEGAGIDAIKPASEILTQKSAELKARRVREEGKTDPKDAMVALAQNLAESMGDTFKSDYGVSETESSRTVTLRECGCIKSIMEISNEYGLQKPQARSIFCGSCMNSYKKAAGILNLDFDGRLSKEGCFMSFSTK